MEWDEERHCRIYVQVSYLLGGKVRTSEAFKIITTVAILEWKWDMTAINFVSELPHTSNGYDAI